MAHTPAHGHRVFGVPVLSVSMSSAVCYPGLPTKRRRLPTTTTITYSPAMYVLTHPRRTASSRARHRPSSTRAASSSSKHLLLLLF
eukprot:scaffold3878_cov60-Phaeocystis_antarctica.AAC.1